MKTIALLFLPFLLVGCASTVVHVVEDRITTAAQEEIHLIQGNVTATSSDAPAMALSGASISNNFKTAVRVVKAVQEAIKQPGAEASAPVASPAPARAPTPEHPIPPNDELGPPPGAARPSREGNDARTGAKVSFLGMDLEFWLGQNDSWATVWKMLTLLLVSYGGFRAINYIFGKKENAPVSN